MCNKKTVGDLLKDIINGGIEGIDSFINTVDNMNTRIKQQHFLFIVGPNGAIEIKDLTKKPEEIINQETSTTCPDCKGDGYHRCEACKGDGYVILRKGLGQTNDVEQCETCHGTGDIICPTCKGSGKKRKIVNQEFVNVAIKCHFNEQKHQTIMGNLNLPIVKIQHDPNFIYVFPAVSDSSLVKDVKFEEGLKIIVEKFKCSPIIIPDIYFKTV